MSKPLPRWRRNLLSFSAMIGFWWMPFVTGYWKRVSSRTIQISVSPSPPSDHRVHPPTSARVRSPNASGSERHGELP